MIVVEDGPLALFHVAVDDVHHVGDAPAAVSLRGTDPVGDARHPARPASRREDLQIILDVAENLNVSGDGRSTLRANLLDPLLDVAGVSAAGQALLLKPFRE